MNEFVPKQKLYDAEKPIDPTTSTGSKEDFTRELADLFALYSVPFACQNDLLSVLKKFAPSINFPVKSGKKRVSSAMDNYLEKDINDFKLDVCKNGCMAFFGFKTVNGL